MSSTTAVLVCKDPNGYYPVEDDCTAFYLCSHGEPHFIKCPDGYHYSTEYELCLYPCDAMCDPNITCTSSTTTTSTTTTTTSTTTKSPFCVEPNGMYPVEDDCTSFYQCSNGRPHVIRCPSGLHFSSEYEVCEHPCDAKCDLTIDCSSPTTSTAISPSTKAISSTLSPHCITPDGLYAVPHDCSSFYLCSNGKEHLIHCPPGLHYSVIDEICEHPCDANCNISIECIPESTTVSLTSSTEVSSQSSAAPLTMSPECEEPNGLFFNPDDCESFYQCSNGKAYLVRCPSGLHFSLEDQMCEVPCLAGCDTSIACPTEIPDVSGDCSCESCFLPDPTDCSAYFFCSNGRLTKSYCPYGMLFNKVTSMCDLDEDVDCEATGDPSMCPEPNGAFEYPGNCKKYLLCNDSVAHIKECKGQLEFDPDSGECSTPNGHCGVTTIDPHCERASGLFSHPENCSLFYQCQNGVAYLKHCSPPLVFNPEKEVCDWPNAVNCGQEVSTSPVPETTRTTKEITFSVQPSSPSHGNRTTTPAHFSSTTPDNECFVVPGVICPCACRVPTYDECSSFYHCNDDGTACKRYCPKGLYFNKKTMVCDLPSNVECRDFFFTTMKRYRSSNKPFLHEKRH